MEPTVDDYADAVRTLGSGLRFFPKGEFDQEFVMELLRCICDEKAKLDWLVATLINHVGEWPGSAQLRAIYASRWTPADGIPGPPCTIHGFTANDLESDWNARQLTAAQQKYLPATDDMKITDEERARIAALEEKIKLHSARRLPQGPRQAAADARLKQIMGGGS